MSVQFWFRLVQFWFQLVMLWFSLKLNQNRANRTKTEPKLNQTWTKPEPTLNQTEPNLNQNWTKSYGSVWVTCWFSLVQFWLSFGLVLVKLIQFWISFKLNQNWTNWTKTEPKLNQHWTKTEPKLNHNFWFSCGSVLVQCCAVLARFGSVLVQLWFG